MHNIQSACCSENNFKKLLNLSNCEIIIDHFGTYESPCRQSLILNLSKLDEKQRNQYFMYHGSYNESKKAFNRLCTNNATIYTNRL